MSDPYAIGSLGIDLNINDINSELSLAKSQKKAYTIAFNAINDLGEYGIKSVGQYATIVVEDRFGKIDWTDPVWIEI